VIELLLQTVAIFVESAPYLVIGFALAGLSSVFLERDTWLARSLSRKLWHLMVIAALLSATITTAGVAISYAPVLPVGATTILVAGAAYVLVNVLGLRRREPEIGPKKGHGT